MTENIVVHKISFVIPISDELINPPQRSGHIEPPTAKETLAFQKWKAKFDPLLQEGFRQGWFRDGGPDYGYEYEKPDGRWVYEDEVIS